MHADARKLLWDALQAADRVARFTHDKTFDEYLADDLLRSGVERQLAIVGEALGQLRRVDPATAGTISPLSRVVEGLRKAIDRGSLFGAPAYEWIGAREKRTTHFTVFLTEIPPNYKGTRDVTVDSGEPRLVPK